MKKISLTLISLSLLGLTSCGSGELVGAGYVTGLMYATRTKPQSSADTSQAIGKHDSWCYRTMGDLECYTQPQPDAAGTLVSVDPGYKRPLTIDAYNKAVLANP